MTISELVSGMDRAEIELLAGEIVARLEGRASSVNVDGLAAAQNSERAYMLETMQNSARPQGVEPETGHARGAYPEEDASWISLRREPAAERDVTERRSAFPSGRSFSGRESTDMQRISDFFMRDSRRYDSGFERF